MFLPWKTKTNKAIGGVRMSQPFQWALLMLWWAASRWAASSGREEGRNSSQVIAGLKMCVTICHPKLPKNVETVWTLLQKLLHYCSNHSSGFCEGPFLPSATHLPAEAGAGAGTYLSSSVTCERLCNGDCKGSSQEFPGCSLHGCIFYFCQYI